MILHPLSDEAGTSRYTFSATAPERIKITEAKGRPEPADLASHAAPSMGSAPYSKATETHCNTCLQ